MPFYDYICRECGKVFDRMVSMAHRNEDQVCPACGGTAVRKAVSSFNSAGTTGNSSKESCSGG